MATTPRVCYFYDCNIHFLSYIYNCYVDSDPLTAEVGNYYYGKGHPMKPHRIRMTHNLLVNYGLYQHMKIYVRLQYPKTFFKFIYKKKPIIIETS